MLSRGICNVWIPSRFPKIGSILNFAEPDSWTKKKTDKIKINQFLGISKELSDLGGRGDD